MIQASHKYVKTEDQLLELHHIILNCLGNELKRRLCEKEQNFEISSAVEAISIAREYDIGSLTIIDLDAAKLPALAKMKFLLKCWPKVSHQD